jgi:hypothetical protein
MTRAAGPFEVTMIPRTGDDGATDPRLGRLSLDKQFHGDLEGSGQGQMLTAMTDVDGSAGYVAIERVTGTLHGQRGSFVLQHSGIMTRGTPQLTLVVVPDSGTDALVGLSGSMSIEVVDGVHSYEFEYNLPDSTGGAVDPPATAPP